MRLLHRRRPSVSGFGPHAIRVRPRSLHVGDGLCATLAISGYPRDVSPGWLEPLLTHPGRLDVSIHVDPVPSLVAADRLRKQLARLESGLRSDHEHGRLLDPGAEVAAEDAQELASRIARGQARLFRVSIYLTVHAATQDELDEACAQARALAGALLLDARPVAFRQLQGWVSSLPLAFDNLSASRTFDTPALAAAFPFTSPDLTTELGPTAVLYGANAASASLVAWDRFAQPNHNSAIIASSGAGKSYLAKLEALRSLYAGIEVAVIDPEDEYARLCTAVGGAYLHLGAPDVRLNPFDLPQEHRADGDPLTRRSLFLHTLVTVMLGEPLGNAARAALDRAILATYKQAGITFDPATWDEPPPLMRDLVAVLTDSGDPNAAEVAAGLSPYVTGSHRRLFDGHTTTRPDSHLIVFSLRDLPEELKAVGTLLTLDAVWRRVSNADDRRPRLVVVDEAWLLMQDPEGAKFLLRMAKAARKHWAGLSVVTQDAADLLGSEAGQAIIANSATQILLRQAPQAIDAITDAFRLSDGERHLLLSTERGTGLLAADAGASRVAFHVLASEQEHRLVTSSPQELAQYDEEDAL
ncbi:ATP-binding protein [Spongiactinospora sp. TRM90649]|uniref:VirB4 family type IV secretion system protein n=1 Tax=Spongiactinospora sp. TRM90649 TaxID=3031114 RepID=UPI0023F92F1A|nr:ATP-binding protein [Spongiactinospora sp. TRM90649]MDF5757604.1 ATP-binding protein [Spongiactinospora sp. TRM90649]